MWAEWVYGRYMNMYKRPRHRRNRDTTPRTGTGPASGSHSAPDATSQAHIAHDQLSAIGQLRARQTDTPATARSIAWTPPRKHTRVLRILKDPECADRHLCYARSGHVGRAARPSAIPERQPQAGRPVVAVPARSGHCRGASSARSPAVLALAAIAQRPRPPPPSSGENPEAGNRNDQAPVPTRRLFAGSAHTGLGAQGECSGGGSG